MNQRSSLVNIANLMPPSACFFCDSLKPPEIDEMCVVSESPRKNAMLPENPTVMTR